MTLIRFNCSTRCEPRRRAWRQVWAPHEAHDRSNLSDAPVCSEKLTEGSLSPLQSPPATARPPSRAWAWAPGLGGHPCPVDHSGTFHLRSSVSRWPVSHPLQLVAGASLPFWPAAALWEVSGAEQAERASTAKDKVWGQDPVSWASGAPRSHTSTGKNAGDGRSGHVLLGNKQPFTRQLLSTASEVSVSGRGSARSSDPGAAGLSEASRQAAWKALGDLILEMISPLSAASISYSGRRAARPSPHQVGGHRAPPGAASHSLTSTDRPALRLWPRARLSGRRGSLTSPFRRGGGRPGESPGMQRGLPKPSAADGCAEPGQEDGLTGLSVARVWLTPGVAGGMDRSPCESGRGPSSLSYQEQDCGPRLQGGGGSLAGVSRGLTSLPWAVACHTCAGPVSGLSGDVETTHAT